MALALRRRPHSIALFVVLAWSLAAPARAVRPTGEQSFLDGKAFFRPELVISSANLSLEEILPELPAATVVAWDRFLASQEASDSPGGVHAYFDPRSGAATNILGSFPLLPGRGVGERPTLEELGRRLGRDVSTLDATVVADAARQFVERHRDVLAIDASQLGAFRAVAVTPELWQVSVPQVFTGLPVRFGRLVVTVKHGNIVLLGTESWGDARVNGTPSLTAAQALERGFAYVEGQTSMDDILRLPALEIVPVAPAEYQQGEAFVGPVGRGYEHRLVWSFLFQRLPDDARWEVLVDAHSGDVLALQDINQYVERAFTGGVYPLTSTGVCPDAQRCGTMQSGWPMPFADTGFAGVNTNSAGIYNYTSGTATTTLTGPYVDIIDTCGAISASSATGDINLGGSNNQHDCTTPGTGGAGNTAASRSAFYEVNKLAELARGWLPTNTWLQSQLDTNVNINLTCNAFWNGSTINFYRSGGGCRNTGEIAAIFDHEWGHGLDDFDAGGALSNSSEAYADIAAIYRLNASCVGYGFFQTLDDGCGLTADGTGFNSNEAQQGAAHCDLDCSGVRDADYLKHNPNTPDTALGFVCTSCLTGPGPCGRQVHCSAAPVRQAAWDLVKRDLTAAPFSYDTQTALLVGSKLFHLGSGNVGAWHACTCGTSSNGCGSTNGYMQWLAADDDNGNINDGTPHMTALFNA
ncbi:MAG: endopeptidase, partial [Thermoanaerobaculia bacterium]